TSCCGGRRATSTSYRRVRPCGPCPAVATSPWPTTRVPWSPSSARPLCPRRQGRPGYRERRASGRLAFAGEDDMAKSAMGQLQERVTGQVIAAGDSGYDEARVVHNAMIDRRPLAVVRCTGVDDVRASVIYAREHNLDLAVRGGSHSVPGFGTVDDGLVIDLSGMRAVTVDPANQTARAQGGATWGDFNDATGAHG